MRNFWPKKSLGTFNMCSIDFVHILCDIVCLRGWLYMLYTVPAYINKLKTLSCYSEFHISLDSCLMISWRDMKLWVTTKSLKLIYLLSALSYKKLSTLCKVNIETVLLYCIYTLYSVCVYMYIYIYKIPKINDTKRSLWIYQELCILILFPLQQLVKLFYFLIHSLIYTKYLICHSHPCFYKYLYIGIYIYKL